MPISRRRFLTTSSAAALQLTAGRGLFAQTTSASTASRSDAVPPPATITGGVQPLYRGHTARPMRYTPDGIDFVIRNGGECFNRPLYGKNNDFRVDGGDRPEFSLWLPGHGGNLRLGFSTAVGARWAHDADVVTARYRPGRLLYEIRDGLLHQATLKVEAISAEAGLLVRISCAEAPPTLRLHWAYAGADGRKGRRNGDIGCETVPVSTFFAVEEKDCAKNTYELTSVRPGAVDLPGARLQAPAGKLQLIFPAQAELTVAAFSAWTTLAKKPAGDATAASPVLTGSVALAAVPLHLAVLRDGAKDVQAVLDPALHFAQRSEVLERLAQTLRAETPDAHVNAALAAIGPAADFLWDEQNQCVMHGDVAWRTRLAGWRGPYCLDALGNHERAQRQFRHWIAGQNKMPVTTGDPATGPADAKTRLARKEHLLHSNGDLSGNHYDMNMVFFDVLFRHLRWTGDVEFAREAWPAIQRHLAWEHRLFRREFTGSDHTPLPLYEAYAAIWASDNLQYSGGGAAHSSAYNAFAFRQAAQIALLLAEDTAPYTKEAELIHRAMQEHLWLAEHGAMAESKDLYGPQTAYANPALWTVYHTIDSEVVSPRQAWQMATERLHTLERIPVHGAGVPEGPWYMLSCSNWMPYLWSLNLLALGENLHMALALWQAGLRDEAFALFKGNLLDSMFLGLCPGDFHMTSALDPHRQEAQRDFGDPIGIASRAMLEGLFGFRPNLLENNITLRPGFPSDWMRASLHHPDFDFAWHRDGMVETYTFTSRLVKVVPITLLVPARTTRVPLVKNGKLPVAAAFDKEAVGEPLVRIQLLAMNSFTLTLTWSGAAPMAVPAVKSYALGEPLQLPAGLKFYQLEDPQRALRDGKVISPGVHTVFARITRDDCLWTVPITFKVSAAQGAMEMPTVPHDGLTEPLDLSHVLTDRLAEIFAQPYAEPRSPYCSLSLPDTLLGGWSNLGEPPVIDDLGLRGSGGTLMTPFNVGFRTPGPGEPNCRLLSNFKPHDPALWLPLKGYASGLYLLVTGTTSPQCSRLENARAVVLYADGSSTVLPMINPETWWPIEQNYLIDDYLFPYEGSLPPRIDLATGEVHVRDKASMRAKSGDVSGGAATMLYLSLDASKELKGLTLQVSLYPVVLAVIAATLVRMESDSRPHVLDGDSSI